VVDWLGKGGFSLGKGGFWLGKSGRYVRKKWFLNA